jgi:adenylate cyclase
MMPGNGKASSIHNRQNERYSGRTAKITIRQNSIPLSSPTSLAAGIVTLVFIVDDDPQISKLICRALENALSKIESVQNGEEALMLVTKTKFKVIISDVKMSRMDGIELLDKVHELDPDITRIILSGHSDVELILKLVNEKGIDKYLVKPLENPGMTLAIRKCIELYDLRNEVRLQRGTKYRRSNKDRRDKD